MDYTRLNRQIAMGKWTDKPHDFGTPLRGFGQQMINMEFGSTLYFQILSLQCLAMILVQVVYTCLHCIV